jgi:hypothetical protein
VAFVRELTIPTERPPLVMEASVNFAGRRCSVVSASDPLRPYYWFARPEPLLFLSSSSSVALGGGGDLYKKM